MSDSTTTPKSPRRERGTFERPTGSGTWWVVYFDEHGKRHREKVGPKGLAVKVYQKRKNEIHERRFFPERIGRRDVLIADYLKTFMAEQVIGRLRNAKHYEQYRSRWEKALKGKTLRQVLPEDVARYVAKRREAGKAPATINRELAFLRRLFNVAIENQKADTNPVKPKLFFKENNQRVRFLSPEEEARLREAVGETDWTLVAVALHTGLRRSEQFHLRWQHVDFGNRIITIPRSKSGETRRVPMNDTVRGLLGTLPSRLKSAWVFPSETGETPLDAQNFVNRVFTKALRKAGIEDFSWHCLRHTFASRLVMAHVDLRTVQELLGHKTLAMTLRYSHLSPAHQLDAVQCLNPPDDASHRATATATASHEPKAAAGGSAEVVVLPRDLSGGAQNRTGDLGIMRPSL